MALASPGGGGRFLRPQLLLHLSSVLLLVKVCVQPLCFSRRGRESGRRKGTSVQAPVARGFTGLAARLYLNLNAVLDSTIRICFLPLGGCSPTFFTSRVYFTFAKSAAIKKPASNLGWTVPRECTWVGGKP